MNRSQYDYLEEAKGLIDRVTKELPGVLPILTSLEECTLHQDAFPYLDEKNLATIGAFVKVAGVYNTEVRFVGRCGDRRFAAPASADTKKPKK